MDWITFIYLPKWPKSCFSNSINDWKLVTSVLLDFLQIGLCDRPREGGTDRDRKRPREGGSWWERNRLRETERGRLGEMKGSVQGDKEGVKWEMHRRKTDILHMARWQLRGRERKKGQNEKITAKILKKCEIERIEQTRIQQRDRWHKKKENLYMTLTKSTVPQWLYQAPYKEYVIR